MADWILLSLVSGLFLGFYEVAKKTAVRDNAVAPVLLLNVIEWQNPSSGGGRSR